MSKEEFITALAKEGYDTGYYNNGIPTVFVNNNSEIKPISKAIRKFALEHDYKESFGVKPKTKELTTESAIAGYPYNF